MTLQTANALLIIRCFTKYIIEIDTESALLEQINAKPINLESNGNLISIKKYYKNALFIYFVFFCEDDSKPESEFAHNQSAFTTSTNIGNESPVKSLNHSRKSSNQPTMSIHSQDDLNENDSSETGSVLINDFKSKNAESQTLHQLITSLFELCIDIPVQAHTYLLHIEVLNNLIVLLSVQMYTKLPTHESYIYEAFMVKME